MAIVADACLSSDGFTGGSPSTLYAYTGTYASLPAASGYAAGTQARVTDVGLNGSMFFSDGVSRWLPVNGRCNLFTLPVPVGVAPTINANASGTANGATTLATATVSKVEKAFWWVDANIIVTGQAAGFYYAEMSSTTAITFYNNTYTPAVGVYPTIPATKNPFVGAVPGGNGSVGYPKVVYAEIPAGILGDYGYVLSDVYVETNISAGSKLCGIQLNGTNFTNNSYASSAGAHGVHVFRNIGSGLQRGSATALNTTYSGAALVGSVDTTASKNYSVEISHNGLATDIILLSSLTVDLVIPR